MPSGRHSITTRQAESHGELSELRKRYDSLTTRERQVMGLVVSGMLNKQLPLSSEPAKSL